MVTRTITYTDFNGEQQTETLYFNLSKTEIAEMELKTPGGYAEKLQRAVASKDNAALFDAFQELLTKAYGVKSEDGRRFIKNDKLREEFVQSIAYEELFFSLINDDQGIIAFVNCMLPTPNNK